MKKLSIICVFLLLLPVLAQAGTGKTDFIYSVSFNQDSFDHDIFFEHVLFDKHFTKSEDPTYWDIDSEMTSLNKIEYASYFCIDQFNSGSEPKHEQDQKKFERLKKHISGLPENIDDLNPTETDLPRYLSGTNHRTYTHRGWGFPFGLPGYPGDLANARCREKILYITVNQVFSFHASENGYLDITGFGNTKNDYRCRSYAKLFYYIHLLGDCYEDKDYYMANGSRNGQKLPLGRANPGKSIETSDLITEIIKVCEDLFSESETNAERYAVFKSQLDMEKRNISDLYRLTGGIYSEERYEQYHERVCSLMNILMINLPKILRNEPDFSEAFCDISY